MDVLYMERCLTLAGKGNLFTAPNPMVGCVVVHENKIVGEGYHEYFGGPHAEVNAIASVSDQEILKDATLYVNLEPCTHFGKTPPCTDLIIEKKIKRVVIGCHDPNPLVGGNGIKKLKANGIDVVEDVLREQCETLNRKFITFHKTQRPWITLKWAESNDGFIAGENYRPVHFTNSFSDQMVHKLRAEHTAILIGGRTAIADNPYLTTRKWEGRSPVRIVIDKKNNLPEDLHIFSEDGSVIIFNFEKNGENKNRKYIKLSRDENVIGQISSLLFSNNIQSVLVEGGATTIQTFYTSGYWDEAIIFRTPYVVQNGIPAPEIEGKTISEIHAGNDLMITKIPR